MLLTADEEDVGAELTLGGADTKQFTGGQQPVFAPLVPRAGSHWIIESNGIAVGQNTINNTQALEVIFDSGTSTFAFDPKLSEVRPQLLLLRSAGQVLNPPRRSTRRYRPRSSPTPRNRGHGYSLARFSHSTPRCRSVSRSLPNLANRSHSRSRPPHYPSARCLQTRTRPAKAR